MPMRLMVVSALVIVALVPVVLSQTSNKMSKDERVKAELMQLERDIGRANIVRDYAFFERVEAEEFVFTDSNGGVTTKKEDLEGLKAPANPDSRLISYD